MATETGFLDLMAYARGAQLANTENQNDATFALKQETDYFKMLADQAKATRDQQLFDVRMPYQQAWVKNQMQGFATAEQQAAENKQVAEFTANVQREAAALPAEQRAGYIAAKLREKLQTATPGEQAALAAFGNRAALDAFTLKDNAGGQALLQVLPGLARGEQTRAAVEMNDWAYWQNQENIKKHGGELTVDSQGRPAVQYAGFTMPLSQFATEVRRGMSNPTADAFPTMAAVEAENRRQAEWMQYLQRMNSAGSAIGQQVIQQPGGAGISLMPAPITQTYPDVPAARGTSAFAPQQAASVAQTLAPPAAVFTPPQTPPAPPSMSTPAAPTTALPPPAAMSPQDQLGARLDAARASVQQYTSAVQAFGARQRQQAPQAYASYLQSLEQAKREEAAAAQAWETYLRETQPYLFGVGARPAGAAFAPTQGGAWLTQPGAR